MIAAVQAWVEAYGQGIRYARCPSAKVIHTLRDTILDTSGKAVASPGHHDEHLILMGQKLRKAVKLQSRYVMPAAPGRTAEQVAEEALLALIRGDAPPETPFAQVAPRPRMRPRI
jgi:hypothetical protein